MEVSRRDARANIREEPTAHCVVDLPCRPMTFHRGFPGHVLGDGSEELRALRKNRIWKSLRFPDRMQSGNRRSSFGEKTMQRDIESKTRRLNVVLFYLHLQPPARNQ